MTLTACGRLDFAPVNSGLDVADASTGDGGGGGDVGAARANYIFASSQTYVAGAIGSLAAADSSCQGLADQAGLGGTYVAWLSTTTTNAIDRLGTARGWIRPDGKPFADTAAAIAAGTIWYPPALDETGAPVSGMVATATDGTGRFSGTGCSDFTTQVGNVTIGESTGTSALFSQDLLVQASCAAMVRLYCVGVDRAMPVAAPAPTTGKLIFVSSSWSSGGGIASADARCAADAVAAGRSGTFAAALPMTGGLAGTRFSPTNGPVVRVDGLVVAATVADLFSNTLETSASQTAAGAIAPVEALSGTSDPTVAASNTCLNWTSTSGGTITFRGFPAYASKGWFGGSAMGYGRSTTCFDPQVIYCLQM